MGRQDQTHAPQPQQTATTTNVFDSLSQRKCACGQYTVGGSACGTCAEKTKTLGRSTAPDSEAAHPTRADPPVVDEVLRSPGQSLDPATRSLMQSSFGHDFSKVRIHTDSPSETSARGFHARAYTFGHHIVLRNGYQPNTEPGRRVLAHELTHVVQQANGTPARAEGAQPSHAEAEARLASERVSAGLSVGAVTRTPMQVALDGDEARPGGSVVIVISLASNKIEFRTPQGNYRYDLTQRGLQVGTHTASVSVSRNRVQLTITSDTQMSGQWSWRVRAGQANPETLLRTVNTAEIQIIDQPLQEIAATPSAPPPSSAEQDPNALILTPEEAHRRCASGDLPVMTFPVRYTRYNSSYLIASREGERIRVRMPMESYVNGRELPGMHHMPPIGVTLGVLLEPNQIVRVRQYTPRLNPFADDEVSEMCVTGEQMLGVSEQGDRAVMMNIALTAVDALAFTPVGAAVGRGVSAAAGGFTRQVVAPGLAAAMIGTASVAEPALIGGASRAVISAVENRAGAAIVENVGSRALAQGAIEAGSEALGETALRGGSQVAEGAISRGLGEAALRSGAGLATSALGRTVRDVVTQRGMQFGRAGGSGGMTGPGGGVPSDIPHVTQTTPTSCGAACGEMATGHHARIAGSAQVSEANLMAQAEYDALAGGMDPHGLQVALERQAPVVGRTWEWHDFIQPRNPTADDIRVGLETALRDGNGVVIVNTIVNHGQPNAYMHWVVVREVVGTQALIHNPEAATATLETITADGFGTFHCTGDIVVSVVKP
jgi:hypothetical protein